MAESNSITRAMMSSIIEHLDEDNSQVVRVGERSTAVSLKVYQDVYHQVTGRTEQLRRRYSENLLLDFAGLEQLHYKISQLCDVHKIVASNEVISIFHDKERKEQFTSFERLRAYNASSASPTVNIVLKYNFSIIPADLREPQEYVVTVRLTSRVALAQQMQREAPPFMHARLFSLLNDNTAEITIDYADYVIARGFAEAFDEWIRSCRCTPKKPWLNILRRWSHIIPDCLRVFLVVGLAVLGLQVIPEYFGAGASTEDAARFSVIYLAGTIVLFGFMGIAGQIIENAIDSYPSLSYLNLNKGDELLIAEFEGKKRGVLWQFLRGSAVVIILGIIATKLEKLI